MYIDWPLNIFFEIPYKNKLIMWLDLTIKNWKDNTKEIQIMTNTSAKKKNDRKNSTELNLNISTTMSQHSLKITKATSMQKLNE